MIDEILDEFDFEKVCIIMEAVNQAWAGARNTGVPSVKDLRYTARNLLNRVEQEGLYSTRKGGLIAYKHDNIIGLRFNLEAHLFDKCDSLLRYLGEGIFNTQVNPNAHKIQIEKGIGQ